MVVIKSIVVAGAGHALNNGEQVELGWSSVGKVSDCS